MEKKSKSVYLAMLLLFIFIVSGCTVNESSEDNFLGDAVRQETSEADTDSIELTLTEDNIGFEELFSIKEDEITYTYFRERLTDVIYIREADHMDTSTTGFTAMLDPFTGNAMTFDNFIMYMQGTSLVCVECRYKMPPSISRNYCPECGYCFFK